MQYLAYYENGDAEQQCKYIGIHETEETAKSYAEFLAKKTGAKLVSVLEIVSVLSNTGKNGKAIQHRQERTGKHH